MSGAPLLFEALPLNPPALVFGDDGSSPIVDAHVSGAVVLRKPTLAGRVCLGVRVGGAAVLRKPTLSGGLRYATDTQRPLVGETRVRFQQAGAHESGVDPGFADASVLRRLVAGAYEDAAVLQAGMAIGFDDAPVARRGVDARFQDGIAVSRERASRFADALLARRGADARYQDGSWLPGKLTNVRQQDGLRVRRIAVTRFQDGLGLVVGFASGEGDGALIEVGKTTRYQESLRPTPGRRQRPQPPQPEPCYTPSGALLFEGVWAPDGALLFVCENHDGPGSEPGETIVVPIRRAYIVQNALSLTRVDGGDVIPASAFAMSLDVDSWTWQWSATLPGAALPLIEPVAGEPVDVLASVNGVAYRLCVERYSRERRFARSELRVSGRGRAAVLDAPYAPELNHIGDADATIQQLLAKVLTINGVPIGWDVDFEAADWLVPGGTWALQGSYIAGVLDIAGAAGAIVQPHRTDATLRVLPRYPAAPWAWDDVTPDFELPAAAVSVEGIEWLSRPAYNRIFVAGATGGGVLGQVTRGGTAGDAVAPMVTHPLITHADGARQRGLAELANTGRQAMVSLRLQVLPETGLIVPGQFVRYADGADTHLGLVRSTALDWQRPTLRQSITLETHLAEA